MELNNISSLNTPNIQDNTNKNKITSSDLHSSINKPDKETVKLTKNNLQSYKLDISSNSTQKAKEQSYYSNSSNADNSAGAQAINDTYMADIVKKSQEKTKPDGVKMDDVSWGLLVEMGEQMGLTDPEKLAKLTIKDVEAYFYTKNIVERGKNLLKDNLTANEYAEYKNTKFLPKQLKRHLKSIGHNSHQQPNRTSSTRVVHPLFCRLLLHMFLKCRRN